MSAPAFQERGSGPTLILVPGLDGTALFFYRQVASLSRAFHVVTFPLPDDSRCSMESLVEELDQLVRRSTASAEGKGNGGGGGSGGDAILCGESFGGALSLSYALTHPRRVRALVILNSFPYIRDRLGLLVGPSLLKLVPWGAMPIVRRFTESHLHTSHTLPEDLDEFHRLAREIGRDGYIRRLEILRSFDVRHRLHEIQAPTLFLAADEDHLIPSVEEAKFMTARMPNATMRVLPGYGHICVITHDFDLMEHISPWLDGLSPTRGGPAFGTTHRSS